jgi:ribosomal protein S18 acetylase RimI-like enzyme
MTVCLPIVFEDRSALSPEERAAVEGLAAACKAADRFDPCMEYDTHLNADRDMPAWRLAWAVSRGTGSAVGDPPGGDPPGGDPPGGDPPASARILAGAACAFAPTRAEGEISACVSPVFRRQGIFENLYLALEERLEASGAESVLLVCEGASPSAAAIAGRLGAALDHGEYLMRLAPGRLAGIVPPSGFCLVPAEARDVDEFSRLSALVFGETPQDARSFAEAVLADPEREQFVARNADGPVGLVAAAREGEAHMIHGLGVLPELRGKGYGGAILDAILVVLRNRGVATVSLEVDVDNAAALALYRSRGFSEESRADYWRVPRGGAGS